MYFVYNTFYVNTLDLRCIIIKADYYFSMKSNYVNYLKF